MNSAHTSGSSHKEIDSITFCEYMYDQVEYVVQLEHFLDHAA